MSDVLAPRGLGNKQGSRTKYFGTDWNPEDFVLPVPPPQVMESLYRYLQGYRLERPEFPEAEAVWNEGRFKKRKDLFFSGPFFVVQGVLADLFSRFNFGDGGLIPFTIFKSDLMTPYPGEFYLLNFGCIKDSIVPEKCEDTAPLFIEKSTNRQIWKLNSLNPDAEVFVTDDALRGPDIWFERTVHEKLFMSEALAQALVDMNFGDVFRLKRCRVLGCSV